MKMFADGLSACKNCDFPNMDDMYNVKSHLKLSVFKAIDDDSLLNRDLRVYASLKADEYGVGGAMCVCRRLRIGCAYQVRRCASLMYRCLKPDDRRAWLDVVLSTHLLCAVDLADYLLLTKRLTVLAKKGRDMFCPVWFGLVDLNTWSGYNVNTKLDDVIEEETIPWLVGDLEVKGCNADLWGICQRAMMKELFVPVEAAVVEKANQDNSSFSSWVGNPDNWVTKGASSMKGSIVNDVGETVKTKGNKANVALSLDVSGLMARVFACETEEIELHPAIKVELGNKNRVIIRCDDYLNIGSSYGAKQCMKLLRNNDSSSLFLGLVGNYNKWVDIDGLIRQDNVLAYPYDAPSFDQRVTTDELRAYFEWKRWLLSTFLIKHVADHVRLAQISEAGYFNQYMMVGNLKYRLGHGMMSGFSDTALGDTVISVSRNSVLLRCVDSLLLSSGAFSFKPIGQGDDFLTISNNIVRFALHFNFVNMCGWGAHIEKNLICVRYCEFLRKYCTGEKYVRGYLSRKMGGLLFRDPLKRGGAFGISNVRERVGALNVLICRGGFPSAVRSMIEDRMKHVIKQDGSYLNRSESFALSRTPASLGGGGIWLDQTPFDGNWYQQYEIRDDDVEVVSVEPTGIFASNVVYGEQLIDEKFSTKSLRTQLNEQVVDKPVVHNKVGYRKIERVRCGSASIAQPVHRMPKFSALVPTWECEAQLMRSVAQDMVVKIVKDGNVKLLDNFLRAESANLIRMLDKRWRRSVLIEWVIGKVRPRSPIVIGFSSGEVSLIVQFVGSSYWNRLINKRNVNFEHIETLSLGIECSAVRALLSGVLPIRFCD
nr:TPA_asm: RNA-dependent RNA polymerase [Phamor tricladivirus]